MSSFSKDDLLLLSQTIATAIQRSGGVSRYNPISNETYKSEESPAARAEAIRVYKNAENHNRILEELIEMEKATVRTNEDMERAVEYNTKSLSKAINSYDDVAKSQKALVTQLQNQLKAMDNPSADAVKALAGNIDSLQDVLRMADLAKVTTQLSNSLEELKNGGLDIDSVAHQLDKIRMELEANGKDMNSLGPDLADIDASLRDLVEMAGGSVDPITKKMDLTALDDTMKQFIAGIMKLQLNSASGKNAIDNAQNIALQSNLASTRAHIGAQKQLTGVTNVASTRLQHWATRVTSAAFVLDKLADAAKYLYQQMLTSASTGTQRSFTDVIGNNVRAISNGIDPKVLQEIQAKNASMRSTTGRDKFDEQVVASKDFLTVTADRGEASRIKADMMSMMHGLGVNTEDASKSVGTLAKSMGKLQYLTGMTGAELTKLTEEFVNNSEFQQSIISLNSKERETAVKNVQLMLEENRVRGISIELSKEIFRSQQQLKHGNKASARLKGSAQIKALGGALGLDVGVFAAASRMKGGIDSYVKHNAKSPEDEARLRKLYAEQDLALRSKITDLQNDDKNISGQLTAEKLEVAMSEIGSVFNTPIDKQKIEANKIIGDAAKEYKEGAEISLGAAKMMMAANAMVTTMNGPIGSLIQGIMGLAALRYVFKGGPGMLSALAGRLKGGVPPVPPGAGGASTGILASVKNFTSSIVTSAKTAGTKISTAVGKVSSGSIGTTIKNGATAAKNAVVSAVPTVTNTIRNAAGPTWNYVRNAATATPGVVSTAASKVSGVVGSGLQAVKNATASLSNILPPLPPGSGGKILGGIAKLASKAPVLTALVTAGSVAAIATDDAQSKEQKTENIGEAVGSGVGGLAGGLKGAAMGAAIGSVVPVVGTAIGGLIGAIGGAWLGSEIGGWGGKKVGQGINKVAEISSSPKPPAIDPKTSTMNKTNSAESVKPKTPDLLQVNNDARNDTKQQPVVDPNIALSKAVDKMTTTLSSILRLMQLQADELNENSEKTLAQRERLRRAIKNSANTSYTNPANAYNK